MTQSNFNQCLTIVLQEEGGYSNNPHDIGGITNLGVTKTSWEEYVGHAVSITDMKSLTLEKVAPFYHDTMWNKMQCDNVPTGLDLCIFDFAVNGGASRSAKFLQILVGATKDGSIGPTTLSLINSYVSKNGIKVAILQFQEMRREYYQSLSNPTFIKGWLARVDKIQFEALKMINH